MSPGSVSSSSPPSAKGQPSLGMRLAALGAAVLLVLIFLGCMSIQIGGFSSCKEEAGVLSQKGTLELPAGMEQDIYYPVAYCRPPNLELDECLSHCILLEQKEDHFRVRNTQPIGSAKITWKARGERAASPPAVLVPAPPPPTPPATGPAPVSTAELPAPAPVTEPEHR